jgi:predicted 3-demethylubiquinone-9 3-methyltransferase (glyoxalase superfamily)
MARAFATFLMFDGAAAEAMDLYASLFSDCSIEQVERYGRGEEGAEGSVKRSRVRLGRHELMFFDSPVKHAFGFTPAISIFVECESKEELGRAFEGLSAGGKVLMPLDSYGFSSLFGWVNDRFGVSWQLNLQ